MNLSQRTLMEYEFIKHIGRNQPENLCRSPHHWRELHHSDMEIFWCPGRCNIDDGQQCHLPKKNDILSNKRRAQPARTQETADSSSPTRPCARNITIRVSSRVRLNKTHILKVRRPNMGMFRRMAGQDRRRCKKEDGYAIEMMSLLNHMLFSHAV